MHQVNHRQTLPTRASAQFICSHSLIPHRSSRSCSLRRRAASRRNCCCCRIFSSISRCALRTGCPSFHTALSISHAAKHALSEFQRQRCIPISLHLCSAHRRKDQDPSAHGPHFTHAFPNARTGCNSSVRLRRVITWERDKRLQSSSQIVYRKELHCRATDSRTEHPCIRSMTCAIVVRKSLDGTALGNCTELVSSFDPQRDYHTSSNFHVSCHRASLVF